MTRCTVDSNLWGIVVEGRGSASVKSCEVRDPPNPPVLELSRHRAGSVSALVRNIGAAHSVELRLSCRGRCESQRSTGSWCKMAALRSWRTTQSITTPCMESSSGTSTAPWHATLGYGLQLWGHSHRPDARCCCFSIREESLPLGRSGKPPGGFSSLSDCGALYQVRCATPSHRA